MTAVDYFISGDHDEARSVLAEAMRSLGFDLATSPLGGWDVTRGSTSATLWLGAFAELDQAVGTALTNRGILLNAIHHP